MSTKTIPTNAEQEAALDSLLGERFAEVEARAVTLPQMLGQPQEYAQIPGLFYLRPKLGHKMDLVREYNAMRNSDIGEDEGMRKIANLFAPYARVEREGQLVPVSGHDLLYDPIIGFDDATDLSDFVDTVLYRAKSDTEAAIPNE